MLWRNNQIIRNNNKILKKYFHKIQTKRPLKVYRNNTCKKCTEDYKLNPTQTLH